MFEVRWTRVLANVDWWVVLITATIGAIGVLFIHSATLGQAGWEDQAPKQVLFLAIGALAGLGVVLVPTARLRRFAWPCYALALLALALLPFFGDVINGARRWYRIFGFGLQPSEFAKLAVVLALAAWLRFRDKARTFEGLLLPIGITAVPVGLIFQQPDLSSSLVFWVVLVAMCYVAGTPGRSLLWLVLVGAVLMVVAWFTVLHDYQQGRVAVWWDHFGWDREALLTDRDVQQTLRDEAYQPWQSLIAIGSGGLDGFGFLRGPQSRFDFLPYRSGDFVFSVVVEETGLLGALGLLALEAGLTFALLGIGMRTRERFGKLCAVGVAAWIGTQTVFHVAVCAWLLPATGLPMPLVSAGGSSTIATVLGVALVVNVGARREPVLASDGFT